MITGVSLGGALAAFASYDIKMYLKSQSINPQFLFYTFGQPRIGNYHFIREINREIVIYRVVDSADPVPHLPPRKVAETEIVYYHPGVEVYYESPDSKSFSICAGDNDKCSLKRKGQF
jgi:predicted lipase